MRIRSFVSTSLALLACATPGSPSVAQTFAPGPYYAMPAWDQTLPANSRFIVLTNMNSAVVLDRETGLLWEKAPGTAFLVGSDAKLGCLTSTTGNRMGWRVPTLSELRSLSDPTQSPMALPAGHPFEGIDRTSPFWTVTPYVDRVNTPGLAHVVQFDFNHVSGITFTAFFGSVTSRVWCVRGGVETGPAY